MRAGRIPLRLANALRSTIVGKRQHSLMSHNRLTSSAGATYDPDVFWRRREPGTNDGDTAVRPPAPDSALETLEGGALGFDSAEMHCSFEFVTPAEATLLLVNVEKAIGKKRYEREHWDSVIVGFREMELGLTGVGGGSLRLS